MALVKAMKLRIGDQLSEGTTIVCLSRSGGHTHAKLDDGRKLIAPDHYLLPIIHRVKAPDDRIESPQSAIQATEA